MANCGHHTRAGLSVQSAARLAIAFGITVLVILSFRQVIQSLILLLAAISLLVAIVKRGVPRTLAVLLIYLGFLLLAGGLVAIVLPRVIDQVEAFVEATPEYLDEIHTTIDQWGISGQDIWDIGPVLAAVPMFAVALIDSSEQALIVLIVWIVIQLLEAYVLTPNVQHRQADVPPLLVLLALFMGGAVYGLVGALVAIPVAGTLRVFIIRVAAPAVREAWSSREDPAQAG